MLTLSVIAIALLYFAFFQPSFVSPEQFERYAQTLISNYNQSLSFFHLETFDSFDFYSNRSYNVTAFLSSNFGTAITFVPSENWSFETVNATQRVEDAIFGSTNSLQLTKFIFKGEETGVIAARNSNFSIVNIGIIADVGSNVLFKNIKIDSVLYNCLIIKGSNESRYWDNNVAVKDSRRIFDADLNFALNRSEDVRMRYSEPELNELLVAILEKWDQALNSQGEITYTFSQKEHDIKEIEELARTKYGITNASQFIQNLLDYLSNVSLPPPKTILNHIVNDPDNWLYVAFLSGLPICIVVAYLAFDYLRKRLRSKVFGYMLGIPLGILVVAFGDVVLGFPYDYRFFSVQTLVVALVWFGGGLAIHKRRKLLTLWRIRKENGYDDTNNNSQQENKNRNNSIKAK
jgi:hypothetical protein